MALDKDGFVSVEELKKVGTYPSEDRLKKGPVAIIECIQEIPCNPCESACNFDAIKIGDPITNIPVLDENKCTGCGLCVAQCPGQAIFLVDKSLGAGKASITFPYEFLPLPEKGSIVKAVDRKGKVICDARVLKTLSGKSFDKTNIITIEIPEDKADIVRSIKIIKE